MTNKLVKRHKITDWYTDHENNEIIRFVIDVCDLFDLIHKVHE